MISKKPMTKRNSQQKLVRQPTSESLRVSPKDSQDSRRSLGAPLNLNRLSIGNNSLPPISDNEDEEGSANDGNAGLASSLPMPVARRATPLSSPPTSPKVGSYSPTGGGAAAISSVLFPKLTAAAQSGERRGSMSFFRTPAEEMSWSGRLARRGSQSQPMDDSLRAQIDGDMLVKRGRPVEAFEFYNKAIKLKPDEAMYYVKRAAAHILVETYGPAVVDCDAALNLDPVCAIAYARKAQALVGLNRSDEAGQCYDKARLLDPKLKELRKINLPSRNVKPSGNLRTFLSTSLGNSNAVPKAHGGMGSPPPPAADSHAQALFERSLEVLMEEQKQTCPNLKVPEVLLYLVDDLYETGGLSSEGIFRLSVGSVELKRHLSRLGSGPFALNTKDPNVFAVILKHFYRHLPEPMCNNFEQCMLVCADYALHDTSASLRRRKDLSSPSCFFSESTLVLLDSIWEAMSENSQNATILLFRLFATLLVPENARATKMTLENLALVFSNGVLRDPDPSALSALASQPSCQRFVTHLYEYVIETKVSQEERLLVFPLLPPALGIALRSRSPPTSMDSDRSSSSFDDFVAPLTRPRKQSLDGRNEYRAGEGMPIPRSWLEFFEQAGLNGSVSQQYAFSFESSRRDIESSFVLFGEENTEELKGLGMKGGHIIKVQKYVRGSKTGSLGGTNRRKGSTLRLGRSTPEGAF